MFTDYLSFGGIEIANTNRLRGYAESAGCRAFWIKGDLCENLRHALDHALPYTYETIDQAPWYDPSQRDLSSRFYGVMVVDADGIQNSSRQIATTEGIVEGGTIGSARRAMKKARFKVMLLAEGDDALDYGIAWLSSALDADKCGQHGGRCGVTDLEFFTTCPEEVMAVYAGDTLVPDTPEHVIEGLRGQSTDLEPIVNHAPPIEGSGNWEPVYENLFTNPRLKGSGGWSEVRRNYAVTPIADYTWYAASYGSGGDGIEYTEEVGGTPTTVVEWSAKPTGGSAVLNLGGINNIPAGEVEASVRVAITGASYPATYLYVEWYNSGYEYISSSSSSETLVSDDPSDPTTLSFTVTPPEGAVKCGFTLNTYGGYVEVGTKLYASSFMLGSGGYFDGNTTPETAEGVVKPEDFRWRWLGTPNDSESVMEIERVAGLSGNYAIAGVSSRDGKPAVRLIPTNESNTGSAALLTVPIEARAGGTALGTLHLDEPLTGPLSTNALSISVYSPSQKESAPNTPGEYPLRLVFNELTSGNTLVLNHGGTKGSGDVWWTDIGLYAGDYPYETFNGESDPADTGIAQPEDFRIRWTGAVDNSTSVLEIETVEGLTGSNAIAGVSTREGKPAVRVIPTGSDLSAAQASIPVTAPSVTVAGTVSLDAPLQGNLDDQALTLDAGGVSASAPNLAGDHLLRAVGGDSSSGYAAIVLTNGATQNNGDVWWYDLGLFEGEYSGPMFNADTGWLQVDGNWYYATEGDDGNATAIPGRMVSTFPTDDIKRFMHDVATSSGPLLLQKMRSGPHRGALMEFTITSERGYIYTAPRELDLAAAELSAAADEDINLAKNPSFELALTSRVAAGYNLATNPSVETNTNNWSTSFGAASRSNLVSAYGSYSYMVELTGSSSILGPDATYTQTNMGVPGQPLAGKVRKLAVGMWGALSVSSGAAQPTQMTFTAIVNGDPIQLETVEDESQFGGYYFMHDLELPSDWDGNLSLLLTSQFSNSGTSTVRLFADGAFIGLGGA